MSVSSQNLLRCSQSNFYANYYGNGKQSPRMSENYTGCIPSTGSAYTTVSTIKSDVEVCTTHLWLEWEHFQVLKWVFFLFLKVDNFIHRRLCKFIIRERAHLVTGLLLRELTCDTSISIFYFCSSAWSYSFSCLLHVKSSFINFDATCVIPEIHKIIIISYLQIFNVWNNFNPLNPELNPICYLLALLGAHHFLHVSGIRVKLLTLRRLMSYIYGAPILDVSRSHTTTQHSR